MVSQSCTHSGPGGTCGGGGHNDQGGRGAHHCNSPSCSGGRGGYEPGVVYEKGKQPNAGINTQGKKPAQNPPSLSPTLDESYSEVVWTIEGEVSEGPTVVAVILYPAVKKFNGLKIAVFRKRDWEAIDKTKIDPHFYEDGPSPMVRSSGSTSAWTKSGQSSCACPSSL